VCIPMCHYAWVTGCGYVKKHCITARSNLRRHPDAGGNPRNLEIKFAPPPHPKQCAGEVILLTSTCCGLPWGRLGGVRNSPPGFG